MEYGQRAPKLPNTECQCWVLNHMPCSHVHPCWASRGGSGTRHTVRCPPGRHIQVLSYTGMSCFREIGEVKTELYPWWPRPQPYGVWVSSLFACFGYQIFHVLVFLRGWQLRAGPQEQRKGYVSALLGLLGLTPISYTEVLPVWCGDKGLPYR